MRAKIRATGEVVEVHYWYQKSSTKEHIYRESSDLRGNRCWSENELDFIELTKHIDWEQRRFELVKSAMQGLCASGKHHHKTSADIYDGTLSDLAIRIADVIIAKLKERQV